MDDLMKLADEYAEAVGRYVSNKATLGEVADARTALLSRSESAHAQGFAAGAAAQLAQEPLCYVRNGEINRWNGLSGMGFSGPLYTRREAGK